MFRRLAGGRSERQQNLPDGGKLVRLAGDDNAPNSIIHVSGQVERDAAFVSWSESCNLTQVRRAVASWTAFAGGSATKTQGRRHVRATLSM